MENELSPELVGLHGLNFAVDKNSAARAVMFASHFSQRLVIEGATEKIIQTGVDAEFSDYTFSIKMPANGLILSVHDRHPKGFDRDSLPFNPETVVIYEDTDTKEIGHFVLKNYASFHSYFGFPYSFKSPINNIVPGNFIAKDTIFADSPSVSENGGFKYGLTLNTVLMSHPAVSEDGIMISKSALKKLKFKVYDTRVIEFGAHSFPLNKYGNDKIYKPFPEIGENIGDDGILMIMRDYDSDLSPVQMSVFDTMEPDYVFDNAVYVRGPGGKIVDIKVYKDDTPQSPMPAQIMDHMAKYPKALKRFHSSIINAEKHIRSERKKKYGSSDVVFKPGLHRLLMESYCVANDQDKKPSQKLNLMYRKTPLDEYRIEFVIEYEITPGLGNKLCGLNGDKGILCHIEDDDKMPFDEAGNRAEIVMDSGSTINRMNLARLYESYISAAARDVAVKLKNSLGIANMSKATAEKYVANHNENLINECYNYLLGLYRIVSPKQYEFYKNLTQEQKVHHLVVASDTTYLFYPIDSQSEMMDVVKELEKHYPPVYSKIKYIGYDNKLVTTKRKIRVAPLYYMLLEKIADDWSAVSVVRLHHFGVLSVTTKSEKYKTPFRNSPVRTIGETEGRIFAGYCGEEAIAEMLDRSNNPTVMKKMFENILHADKPANIERVVDRNIYPLSASKPLQLINHMAMVSGWRSKYVPERIG